MVQIPCISTAEPGTERVPDALHTNYDAWYLSTLYRIRMLCYYLRCTVRLQKFEEPQELYVTSMLIHIYYTVISPICDILEEADASSVPGRFV